jgi:hypothetical protein
MNETTATETRPLPPTIEPRCAAGSSAQVSRTAHGWVIHPTDYDPASITAEDLVHDNAVRRLTVEEESELLPAVGSRVCGGAPGTEDYDEGRVTEVDGDQVTVAWDSQVTTTQRADALRPL